MIKRVVLAALFVVLGAFLGRVASHSFGHAFTVPEAPNPEQWRIISPGLQEGVGPAGAGRVTHTRGGSLVIATHVFFRPDMVVPLFQGPAHGVDVELDERSGTLWMQIGEAPSQFIQLQPGAMRGGAAGSEWTPTGSDRFALRINGGVLTVESGEAVMTVGPATPGRLELSAAEDWPRIRSVRVLNGGGETIFQSNFGKAGTPLQLLRNGTLLGAGLGLIVGVLMVPFSWTGFAACVAGMLPPAVALTQPTGAWLAAVERLYLSQMQPSKWAVTVLLLACIPIAWMGLTTLIRLVVGHAGSAVRKEGPALWFGVAAFCMLIGVREWSVGLTVVLVCMVVGALRIGRKGPAIWWVVDAIGWLPLVAFGPENAALLTVLWRLATMVGMSSMWLHRAPRPAVEVMVLCVMLLPISIEIAVASSPLGNAWKMGRLSAERPNERGWENPSPGWQGQCGSSDPNAMRTIAFAGGSSVGGAYQFGDEPEAFFPAVAHQRLCELLPADVGLTTQNFGDGDLNTFTISRTLDAHLQQADILVLYVGVNDVLTQQNTRTRKEREAAKASRGGVGDGLASWASESAVMVGLSLWTRGVDDPSSDGVADVPLPDARDNHEAIVRTIRSQSKTVVLMTEHVHSGLSASLRPYAQMQRSFAGDDVMWLDTAAAFEGMATDSMLVDRNHLSREGNAALGRFIADALMPTVQGSSR